MSPSLLRARAVEYRALAASWYLLCERTHAILCEFRAERLEMAADALEAAS